MGSTVSAKPIVFSQNLFDSRTRQNKGPFKAGDCLNYVATTLARSITLVMALPLSSVRAQISPKKKKRNKLFRSWSHENKYLLVADELHHLSDTTSLWLKYKAYLPLHMLTSMLTMTKKNIAKKKEYFCKKKIQAGHMKNYHVCQACWPISSSNDCLLAKSLWNVSCFIGEIKITQTTEQKLQQSTIRQKKSILHYVLISAECLAKKI